MDKDYPRFHRNRTNLLIHIFAVPVFIAGTIGLVTGAIRLDLALLVAGLATMMISLAVQGRGHRLEENPPLPFTGPGNFLFRIFREQLVTFPWFVLGGRWKRAVRQ